MISDITKKIYKSIIPLILLLLLCGCSTEKKDLEENDDIVAKKTEVIKWFKDNYYGAEALSFNKISSGKSRDGINYTDAIKGEYVINGTTYEYIYVSESKEMYLSEKYEEAEKKLADQFIDILKLEKDSYYTVDYCDFKVITNDSEGEYILHGDYLPYSINSEDSEELIELLWNIKISYETDKKSLNIDDYNLDFFKGKYEYKNSHICIYNHNKTEYIDLSIGDTMLDIIHKVIENDGTEKEDEHRSYYIKDLSLVEDD